MYRILEVMDLNDGIVSYYEAMKLSGSPMNGKITKTDTLDKIIGELTALNIIKVFIDSADIKYLIYTEAVSVAEGMMKEHRVRMVENPR